MAPTCPPTCLPIPMNPTPSRELAAGTWALPRTPEGMIIGAATATEAALTNCRREREVLRNWRLLMRVLQVREGDLIGRTGSADCNRKRLRSDIIRRRASV